jgi:peptidoglycan/LPS O-acetylase OafA/YrhL
MKSSGGAYFIALDHVRALAAFLVFTWHFIHAASGFPVPFAGAPLVLPLALLDEGHTGVALFMTLSGYLFAKLLEGKTVHYGPFLRNRALRLLPLLLLVVLLWGVRICVINKGNLIEYLEHIAWGPVKPTLPSGGWSITVEFHFYLLLPLLLWMLRRSPLLPASAVAVAVALRIWLYSKNYDVFYWSYWTVAGRIDQFVLGMLFCRVRDGFRGRHVTFAVLALMFCLAYWCFDAYGGYQGNPGLPRLQAAWIFLPTLEGLMYGLGIAWYDTSFSPPARGISGFLGRIGEVSYSIYLLHFLVVFHLAEFVDRWVMDLSNFYVACLWSLVCFLGMVPIGIASFRFYESPFLRFRKKYTSPLSAPPRVPAPMPIAGPVRSTA